MNRRSFIAAAAIAFSTSFAAAETYPSRPVTLIVPVGAGGSVDLVGRYLAEQLSQMWSQPVVVENKPGAGMVIGSTYTKEAAPDGYTLMVVSVTFTTNSAIQKDLPFDPVKDFTPVAMLGTVPLVTAANASSDIKTMQDLIDRSKATPLMYGALGLGSVTHFAFELINKNAGLTMEPIQYKAAQEALVDLIGGRLDVYMGSATYMLPYVKDGKITALAVGSKKRLPSMPDVPTLAEAGVPNSEVDQWWGVLGPAGMDPELVARLNADITTVMSTDKAKAFLANTGGEPWTMSAPEFATYMTAEIDRWKQVAKDSGIGN